MPFIKKLLSFEGRARRSEFWLTRLGATVVVYVLFVVMSAIYSAVAPPVADTNTTPAGASIGSILFLLVCLVMGVLWIWVELAVAVRRCHDRNHVGAHLFIALIPFIGGLWLLVELGFLDSVQGGNRFGRSDKYPERVAGTFA